MLRDGPSGDPELVRFAEILELLLDVLRVAHLKKKQKTSAGWVPKFVCVRFFSLRERGKHARGLLLRACILQIEMTFFASDGLQSSCCAKRRSF